MAYIFYVKSDSCNFINFFSFLNFLFSFLPFSSVCINTAMNTLRNITQFLVIVIQGEGPQQWSVNLIQ